MSRIGTDTRSRATWQASGQLCYGSAASETLPISEDESKLRQALGDFVDEIIGSPTAEVHWMDFTPFSNRGVESIHLVSSETAESNFSLDSRAGVVKLLNEQLPSAATRESRFAHRVAARVEFHRLYSQWREETAFLSSLSDIAMNSKYQQIIGMGRDALPLIFNELQRKNDHWYWALEAITGKNPAESCKGDLEEMRTAWIAWAKANGVLL